MGNQEILMTNEINAIGRFRWRGIKFGGQSRNLACVMEPFSYSTSTSDQPMSDQPAWITTALSTDNEKDSGSGTELNTSSEEMNTESIPTSPGLTVPAKTTNETASMANNGSLGSRTYHGSIGHKAGKHPEGGTNPSCTGPSGGDCDAAFVYDYSSLRHVGLFVAAVLFLMGIAVVTFGRVCRKSRCHVTSGKFYEVNRV
ncbi:FXYD domain containing ion transport regulator 5 isoform X2 [Brienomyrus brachyistius]|uniref:FXYD domain containing ion transport regulator 5 isoform X2 n=1 Tax=Brienomyrus brachyistius TaxID=42636 RepID=UPI0020B3D170|nr:FXYD domain containing ion transport regulator 5 isoform X2 [Brienomyrus brachyistius]